MVEDKSQKAKQIMGKLRQSAGASTPPPAGGSAVEDATTVMLAAIEARQVMVVEAIDASLETAAEVVAELQASVVEGEKVRVAVRKLTREVYATRKLVKILNYTTTSVVLAACVVIVVLVAWQMQIVQGLGIVVGDMAETVRIVDSNTARMHEVVIKQASAHAKRIEAESSMTPQAEEAALEAAVDVQEEAAVAQIENAQQRKVEPPPGALWALKEARAKKAQLREPHVLQSSQP